MIKHSKNYIKSKHYEWIIISQSSMIYVFAINKKKALNYE